MKYIIGFLLTIGLLILLIVLLATGGSNTSKVPNTSKKLDSYATTDAVTRLTIDGPITNPQEHKATRITVGRDSTTYEQLQGYDGAVVNTQSFPNTHTSYLSFLRAIELAGFTLGDKSANVQNDRGHCPLGNRYIFELENNGKQVERFWSSGCSGPRSFKGNTNLNISLFKRQVPGFDKLDSTFNNSFNL